MKKSKVWVVIGAATGLGPGAVKYLASKQQVVVAIVNDPDAESQFGNEVMENLRVVQVDMTDRLSVSAALKAISINHNSIDFIINNSNYEWFKGLQSKTPLAIQSAISQTVRETIGLIKELSPYLTREPRGSIINIPPQLCIETMKDKAKAPLFLQSMDQFLTALHKELQKVDCRLSFLKPGERFSAFAG